MPHGQAITLDQLNAFLEACRMESIQNLEDKEALLNALGDSEAKSESKEKIRKLLEIYNNKQNIHYDENGNLNSVGTIGFSLTKSSAFNLLEDPFCLYNKSKWGNWIKENGKIIWD